MSTTEIGNEFRSHVLALLQTKYPDAVTEKKASWKNADIVFSMMDFSKRVQVGVECKYYNRKLTTADFRKILIDYEAAFSKQSIATLLVVSRFDIEAASRQLVNDTPRLRFMLANELEEWLVGLRPYIEGLCNTFNTADVSHYYIDSRAVGHTIPAFDVLTQWLKTDEFTGIAILGGYGLGKSSIAMRLASHQAKRYLADPANERMPILLRLGPYRYTQL